MYYTNNILFFFTSFFSYLITEILILKCLNWDRQFLYRWVKNTWNNIEMGEGGGGWGPDKHLEGWKNIQKLTSGGWKAYSRPLLGAIIVPNLVLWVLKKMFLLETVKNDICLKSASKQNALFSCPPMSRIGSGLFGTQEYCEIFNNTYFEEHLRTDASVDCILKNCFHQFLKGFQNASPLSIPLNREITLEKHLFCSGTYFRLKETIYLVYLNTRQTFLKTIKYKKKNILKMVYRSNVKIPTKFSLKSNYYIIFIWIW